MQVFDRRRDVASLVSVGTGNLTVAGTPPETFLSLPEAKLFYTIQAGTQWESGIGSLTGTTFSRLVVLSNSNNDQSLINFADVTLDLVVTAPVHGVFDRLNHLSLTDRKAQTTQLDYYGCGEDDITITSNTTLTRSLFARNILIEDASLFADGYQIVASESIQITGDGEISANGSTSGSDQTIGAFNYGNGNLSGGAPNAPLLRGGGGVGGGGSITNLYIPSVDSAYLGNIAGGGSGGYGTTAGSGGGRFVLAAPIIINGSRIQALGGEGTDGGGGGGGLIYVITDKYVGTYPSVTGGDGTTTNGASGRVILFSPKNRSQT